MVLHLGSKKSVLTADIIAILDLGDEELRISLGEGARNKAFRSCILTNDGQYFSKINAFTLASRCAHPYPADTPGDTLCTDSG